MRLHSGKAEGLPYSLSRWTDVPGAKWAWFRGALERQEMLAIDPRTGVPGIWSLKPEDTLGLVFWTKDPANLLRDQHLLVGYMTKVHVTVTGWGEVEKGAPTLVDGAKLLEQTARAFGVENVTWRFSPVPVLPEKDLLQRFFTIATYAQSAGLREVFVSFLQTNDLMGEPRKVEQRLETLDALARVVAPLDIEVLLCNEDRTLEGRVQEGNLSNGICAEPFFGGNGPAQVEGCGCVLMADPFTINESCTMGCSYCYAADKTLSTKKRNTTKVSLEVLR